MNNKSIAIALVDDHILLRSALAVLINKFDNCQVRYQFSNGEEMVQSGSDLSEIDLILLDLNMPVKDGYDTAIWLKEHFPSTPVLMLTMYDSELTLIRLLQAGVKGFLKKDIGPTELQVAIRSVLDVGYYYSNQTAGKIANLFMNQNKERNVLQDHMLDEREVQFLKLVCSDLTYKEIAQNMFLTPRSVDALRDQLFLKLDVKSRVGLAMMAIRIGVYTLNP